MKKTKTKAKAKKEPSYQEARGVLAKPKTKATKSREILVPVRDPVHRPMSESQEMLDLVRDPSVDPGKLKALLDMKNDERTQVAKTAYAVAMSSAQSSMDPVRKDCENRSTSSKYASYAALDRAIRKHYSANGFALSYNTEEITAADMMRVTCDVMHTAGYSKNFHIDIPIVTKGPRGNDVMTATHATMSANTYGKRGLLKMIFNIAEYAEDDDGNAAGRMPISEKSLETLKAKLAESGADEAHFLQWMGVEALHQIPEVQLGKAMVGLEQRAKLAAVQAEALERNKTK
jgi:hypothetical protein